jgi:hypothetical protein
MDLWSWFFVVLGLVWSVLGAASFVMLVLSTLQIGKITREFWEASFVVALSCGAVWFCYANQSLVKF